jgi:hypothetical protein
MNALLVLAAVLTIAIGLAHSILGEWLLLRPLFARGQLTKLVGSRTFARRVLRFAWHLMTVLLVGIGGAVLVLAMPTFDRQLVWVIRSFAITFAACAVVSLVGGRGKHFSWWIFSIIAVLLWIGANGVLQ